jgi:tetratricopeptide (TPR) repeat protein/DNA-binding XRE family transcriptional regulator
MTTGLGGLLRGHRAAAGLSREALAERAELSVEAIRALENGRRRYPRPSTVDQLAGALRLSAAEQELLAQSARRPVASSVPNQLPPDLADFVGRYRLHDLIRAVGNDLVLTQTSETDREALRLRVLDQYVAMVWRVDELDPQSPLRTRWRDPAWSAGALDLADLQSAAEAAEADRANLILAAEAAAVGSTAERERVVRLAPGASLACRYYRRWPEWRQINAVAIGLIDEQADQLGAFLIHFDLGLAQAELGDLAGGSEHLATARRLAAALGDADYEAKSLMNLAHVLEQADLLDAGQVAAADSLAQALRLGNEDLEAYSRLVLGQIAGKEGDLETQREAFRTTIELVTRVERPSRAAALQMTIAESYRMTGQFEEALVSLRNAEAIYRSIDPVAGLAEVLDGLGAVWFELGRYQEALEAQRDGLRLALEARVRDREASIRVRLGQTLDALGQREEATVQWRSALGIYESHGSPRADLVKALLPDQ